MHIYKHVFQLETFMLKLTNGLINDLCFVSVCYDFPVTDFLVKIFRFYQS